jgi:hypothetical protein
MKNLGAERKEKNNNGNGGNNYKPKLNKQPRF